MKREPDSNGSLFGTHKRKVAPFELENMPWSAAEYERLVDQSRAKAASLNQHVLGFGDLAEGEWKAAGLVAPDMAAMRSYRISRIVEQVQKRDLAGVVVFDPINIRYATDSTNMQIWVMHNATRFCFIGANGKVILFDYHASEHLSDHSGMADEVRHCLSIVPMYTGDLIEDRAAIWADTIADLLREFGGSNKRLAFDHIDIAAVHALDRLGIEIASGQEIMELARAVKSPDEIHCMRRAMHSCEQAMHAMEAALKPGMSENDLWAVLHYENIIRGGEWIETRLLSSGPRTNPWFQESSSRIIEVGDIVAFDTDLIGPYGICADISRTWLAGDGEATSEQRELYRIALDQITYNTELLRPGLTMRDLWEQSRLLPPDCLPNRYGCIYHGVGLCDEYPTIPYPQDLTGGTPADDLVEPGMVLCPESYTGRLGGHEGVKLESQVLITETGHEVLSSYPWDERLSA